MFIRGSILNNLAITLLSINTLYFFALLSPVVVYGVNYLDFRLSLTVVISLQLVIESAFQIKFFKLLDRFRFLALSTTLAIYFISEVLFLKGFQLSNINKLYWFLSALTVSSASYLIYCLARRLRYS
jgi:hypothetical protein